MEQQTNPLNPPTLKPTGEPLKIADYTELTTDGSQVVIRAVDLANMVRKSDRAILPFIEAKDTP